MINKISKLFTIAIVLFAFAMTINSCSDEEVILQEKIYGTITFENADVWQTWVDSGEVQVTLFPEFNLDPFSGWGEVPDDTFGPGVLGGTFAIGAPYNSQNPIILEYVSGKTEYDFEIEVEPGTYSALSVGFRHDGISDPSLKSASLGVHFDQEDQVSHGVVIKIDVGGGNIISIFDYPAPTTITIAEGEQKEINLRADFDFVNQWYQ